MEKKIRDIIYQWVRRSFGTQEAEDPSWNIEDLSKELTKHFHDLYWQQELDYIKEDVAIYAEEHQYKLTKEQICNVADNIRNSEWYCSIDTEDMEWYIKQELRKEKGGLANAER